MSKRDHGLSGDPNYKKSIFRTQNYKFSAPKAPTIQKEGFKRKIDSTSEFRGKFGQILSNIVILNYFGQQNNIFSISKKLENFR